MNSWIVVPDIISRLVPAAASKPATGAAAEVVVGDRVDKVLKAITQKEECEMWPRRGGERLGVSGVECVIG